MWGPEVHGQPAQLVPSQPQFLSTTKVPTRDMYLVDIEQEPSGIPLWRRQPWVVKAPQRYGTEGYSLGHYQPFYMPIPITSNAPFVESSAFMPISRGGKIRVSLTEMDGMLPQAPTWRAFANTRLGLWFKSWYLPLVRLPLGSRQVPQPAFRGVFPQYGYQTLPQIIGS
jgi:hypothetical protein